MGEMRWYVTDGGIRIWLHVTIGSPHYVNHAVDKSESRPLVLGLRIEAPERVLFLRFDDLGSAELLFAAGNVQGMRPLYRLLLIRALQHVRDYIESVRGGVNDRCPYSTQIPSEILSV